MSPLGGAYSDVKSLIPLMHSYRIEQPTVTTYRYVANYCYHYAHNNKRKLTPVT